VITCPSCGAENPGHFKFCGQCAAQLAGPRPSAEERKTVTTLFCDLVGFTSMSETADPEEVDALLRTYFARATQAIEAHGGAVEKFIGDAVVGVFGVPVVHEDDPQRAVRAGLAILDELSGLLRPDGTRLEARVGVNTGLAVVRLDVAPGTGEGFLTGDAVNTAARLQAAAPPMGVVVGELTHRLTASAFVFVEMPPLSLKGKSARVRPWRAREPAARAARHAAPRTPTPMVGRKRELAEGTAAIEQLRKGAGGLLLITGEAGIGKTRLVQELRAVAEDAGCGWLEGRTLSFGRSISYWPFLEIVQQDAEMLSDDAEAERAAKLAARVTQLFGKETGEVLPYLATLLALPVPEEYAERVRDLDGEAMGHQLYRAARLYFSRLATERPLIVIVEDLHWLDASSAALLEHLLPLVDEVAIFFCCVSRPEFDSPVMRLQELARTDYADRADEIIVQALSADDSVALVRQLTSMDEVPAEIGDLILAKAQGNPFFVEEIVRSLMDLGALERVEAADAYRTSSGAVSIALPDTLSGVIMARVDRLDDDLKQVLRLASVIGRTFFYRLLESITEVGRDLEHSLACLQARELVLEKARDPELEYMFKHGLVQEATYGSILLQHRRDLHRRVAVAIEALFTDRLEESYSLLAYHYSKAEDWEKAQEYLLKAADQAGSIAADAEALAHYEDAIDAYARAFGDSWDPLERAALERKMGEALHRQGDSARATEYLLRALLTLGSAFPSTRASVRRSLLVEIVRQAGNRLLPWWPRRTKNETAIRIAQERCHIYYTLVWSNMLAEPSVMLLGALFCLNVGERAGLQWAASWGASWIALALQTLGSRRLFGVFIRHARSLAEEDGLDRQLAQAAWVSGMYELWTDGDLDAAGRSLRQAEEIYDRLGDARQWATAAAVAVTVPALTGDWDFALQKSEEITRLGIETGDRIAEAWGRAWEGELVYLMGDMEAGEAAMRRTLGDMADLGDLRVGANLAGRLAACLLAQGRLEPAQTLLAEQLQLLHDNDVAGGLESGVFMAMAAASLMEAERSEGTVRAAAFGEAKRACRTALRQTRLDRTALVPAWRLQGTYEWVRGRSRRAQECWRKSLEHAARIRCRYEGALTMLEMGRRLGDREHLERAEAEFAAMGAQFWLAQTQDLLAALSD
jgi:class 3 adenylate cyclase/tetratricopeptide (TPR) repeat protein